MDIAGHKLVISTHMYTSDLEGSCECSDPDWIDDGWQGQVSFYGATEEEIIDAHHDHVLEVGGFSE